MPKGTVPGVRISIIKAVESTWLAQGAGGTSGATGHVTRTPTKGEISLLVIPPMQAEGFELVGEPKYVVDENPIWVWRRNTSWCGTEDPYQLVVGSGPFKGYPSWCMIGTPNVQETVKYGDKAIVLWSAVFRSTDLELLTTKLGRLRVLERHARRDLALIAGEGGEGGPARKDFKAEIVPVAEQEKETGGAAAVAIAAIVGIGLMMFNLGAGGQQ
jgi:hypothetical protein